MLLQILIEQVPQVQEAIAPVAVGLIMGGIKTALGAYQEFKSQQALDAIAKEKQAKFEDSPGLERSRITALELIESGVPEARAAFSQGLASEGELSFRRATDVVGGNLAQSIGAGIQSRNIQAISEFEGTKIPALKRLGARDVFTIEKEILRQKNLSIQEAIEDRLRREQAFGEAGSAGLENIVEGLTTGVALGTGGIGGTEGTAGLAGQERRFGRSARQTAISDIAGQEELQFSNF